MKSQTTGLVLCALVLSTFGYDIVNRHHTSCLPEKCEQLDNSTRSNFQLIINANTNLVATVNVTAALATVSDVSHSYVALFFGSTGNVIIFNTESKTGVFISGDSSHHGWLARSESFEVYFKSLTSLEPLFKTSYNTGEKFTLGDVSPKISHEIKLARIAFSRGEFYVTQSSAVQLFTRYAAVLVETLKGPLNGFLKIVGSGVRTLDTSMRVLTVFLYTLGQMFSKIKGGVTVLADLHLDWNFVLNSKSWLQLFTYFFSKLKEHNVDLRPVVRYYADNFFVLLVGLAGNSTQGTNGVLRTIADVKATILSRKTTSDAVVNDLLEYFSHPSDNTATLEDFIKELHCVIGLLENIGLSNADPNLIPYVRGLEKGHFVDNGVDVSKITSILFDRNTHPLRNTVSVLSLLQKYVSIENSIAILLSRLINFIVDRDVDVLRSLVPGVEVDGSVDFLLYVFRDAKVSDLKRNLYEFLRGRPVLGQILQVIESSLESLDRVSLKEIIASPRFRKYRCVLTKTLAKVINSIEEGCQGGAKDARQLKSHRYEGVAKHFGAKDKQHREKHLTHEASQRGKIDRHNGHGKQHKI